MRNLRRTSRTSNGVVDTSATKVKADSMASGGEEAAKRANENYESTMTRLFRERHRRFRSPEELGEYVKQVAADVNKGILKDGVLLRRADSEKFPYTRISDLPQAFESFSKEFFQRLNNPQQNPQELAAWVEFNIDPVHHFFEDGCGKTAKAISQWVLARNGIEELPSYEEGSKKYYAHVPDRKPTDSPADRETQFKQWRDYYSSLFHGQPH